MVRGILNRMVMKNLKDEAKNMNDFFTKENDERKKNLDDVNEWIGVENAKR